MDLFESFVKYNNNQKFKNNLVFLTRHGNTFKDQTIDVKKFDKQANKNVSTINKLTNLNKNDYKKFIIYCSPFERCVQTANILKKKINKYIDIDIDINIDNNLVRWDKHGSETREDSIKRATKYGKYIKKNILDVNKNKYCYFFITHSSILFYIIEGIINKEIEKKNIKSGAFYVVDHHIRKIVFQDI